MEVPYLRVANVGRGALSLGEVKRLRVTESELRRTRLVPGDLLVVEGHGNKNEIGRVALWGDEIDTCVHQNHLIRVRCHEGIVLPRFLEAYMNSDIGRRALFRSANTTSGLNTISTGDVRQVQVPLPSIDEQRRIAAVLDAADALRAKRRQALDKLDTLTRAIFIDMFGDPVSNPKRWPDNSVDGALDFLTYGHRFYDDSYAEVGTPVVRITDLDESGNLDFATMPRMALSDDERRKYRLLPGDILFARSGATVGKVALIREGDPECIAGAYFVWMRFNEAVHPEYARSVLTSASVRGVVSRKSRQAAQQNFSGPAIRRLPMPRPPLDLQQAFDRRVFRIRSEVARHRRSAGQLDVLFASLQQRAFRGEL